MVSKQQLKSRVLKRAGAMVFASTDIVKAEAQNLITSGSTSGKNHVASKPGEPPNADTRQLDKGIVSRKTGPLTAEVRSQAPYSAALQFGADLKLPQGGTATLKPRPFMDVAVERRRKDIEKLQRRAIKEITR